MNSSTVNVLTPNGRRMNVKVQPNTTILKVLEDVCQKYEFDPNCYDLKHHKRVVDLSTMYRFSGLPNNAQLEMVEAQVKRQEAEVELLLQLPDGARLDGKFKPSMNIFEIVEQLWPAHSSTSNLVAIYMRTEIVFEKMRETSLKSLGLVSGRAILRLVERDPDAAKITANVALNLPIKVPAPEETSGTKYSVEATTSMNLLPSTSSSMRTEIEAEQKAAVVSTTVDSNIGPKTEMVDVEMKGDNTSETVGPNVEIGQPEDMIVDEDDEDEGEAHVLGERNAVVFSLESMKMSHLKDFPDSFYDLNVRDIKLIIKDLRTQIQGTSDQPLLTAQLRDLEESKESISKLNRYKKAIIRIEFPDRHVLQGTFMPTETIGAVMDFVRPYLASPKIDFVLYTTPPKVILSQDERLFEAQCVPSAILHFGANEATTKYLNDDTLERISSPKACLKIALSDRGLNQTAGGPVSTEELVGHSKTGISNGVRRPNPDAFTVSSASIAQDDVKAPKWFKGFGK